MNQSGHDVGPYDTSLESSKNGHSVPDAVRPIRIFIIDDNRPFAEAMAALLSQQEKITLVDWTVDPDQISTKMRSTTADVVLINAAMKGGGAIQAIREIKEELPHIKVILIGLDRAEEDNLKFIEAGASGYLFKDDPMAEMLRLIELVHLEQIPCSARMVSLVISRINELSREQRRSEILPSAKLTPREEEILRLIAAGLSNKEIAQRLCIALYTVKNHVHNMLEKLQVHGRREAIRFGYENGVLKGSWPRRLPFQRT